MPTDAQPCPLGLSQARAVQPHAASGTCRLGNMTSGLCRVSCEESPSDIARQALQNESRDLRTPAEKRLSHTVSLVLLLGKQLLLQQTLLFQEGFAFLGQLPQRAKHATTGTCKPKSKDDCSE